MPSSWNYRYDVEDPDQIASGLGVPHTVEINAIFGPDDAGDDAPTSYRMGRENAEAVPVLRGYWSSFIRSYDPNTYRYPGSVKWESWSNKTQQRIVFETGGKTKMETIGRDLQKKCNFFSSIGVRIRQ